METGFEGEVTDQAGEVSPEQVVETPEQTQEAGGNPAWGELLNEIPEGFKGIITPHLEKWDKGVNEQFQQRAQEIQELRTQLDQYQPYSEFVQSGLTPEHFKAAQVIIDQLNSNPEELYRRLGEHFGFNSEQAPEGYEEEEEQQPQDPRLDQLQQQQEAIAGFIAEQHQQQVREQANQQVENELNELEAKYNLSPLDKREVLQRAVIMSQQNPNVTLEEAFVAWDQVKRAMFEQQQRPNAPGVVTAGGGGNPVTPPKSAADMSDKEFNADLLQALKSL